MRQNTHYQGPDTEAARWNTAIHFHLIIHTCAFRLFFLSVLLHPDYTSALGVSGWSYSGKRNCIYCNKDVSCPALKGATKLIGERERGKEEERDANQTLPEHADTVLKGRNTQWM